MTRHDTLSPTPSHAPPPGGGASPDVAAPDAISALEPDWEREEFEWFSWSPGMRLLRTIRRYRHWQGRWGPIGRLARKVLVLRHRFWSVVCGVDIPINSQLGGGFVMPHPMGIVIHHKAVIGPNCLVFHGVTIGSGGRVPGLPQLGGHVDVGAGAKLLGGIKVGDHAKIGANAVVLCDVPPGATAVGVPARVIPPRREESCGATA